MLNDTSQKELLTKALSALEKYKSDKEHLNRRIRENDLWYKARYGEIINPGNNETEPATAFIFSAIENKYADAVDNYPMPNVLEREESDKNIAETISKILPVQLDMSDFKKVYKTNWRRKLKHGTGIYGVFYDRDNDKIVINSLSVLNVYCDMYVDNVQDSKFLFIVNAVDNDELKEMYPDHREKFTGSATVETFEGTHEAEDRTEIVDCYYKKGGKVFCMKLCNNEVIAATDEEDYPEGFYRHGMYPVVFDILYPEENRPFGFGVIDICKNPQVYIDKLDGAIAKNAMLSSKIRFLVKDSGSVNEKELLDCENDVVHVAGSVDNDSIRELKVSTISGNIMDHRSKKIEELKEVAGNRDFQQGGTNGGVTAASAISILQEAGNKLSRAAIDDSYDGYKQVVVIVIELMREFFTEKKVFRITEENGATGYAELSSDMMFKDKAAIRDVPESVYGILDEVWKGTEPIEFDVRIMPQKQNPFQREANNSTILQLWQAGFFNPQAVDMSIIALQAMSFDGRDKVIQLLTRWKDEQAGQVPQNPAGSDEEEIRRQIESGELVPIEQGVMNSEALLMQNEGEEPLVPVEEGVLNSAELNMEGVSI